MSMTWQDSSEIVCGLILSKKLSPNSVRPNLFFGEYSNLVKYIKSGIVEPEELIQKCGLSVVQSALDAAKSVNGLGDRDWIQILESSASNFQAGKLMEKFGRRLQSGDEVDWSQLTFISQKAQEGHSAAFVPLSAIKEGEIPFVQTGWPAIDHHLGGLPSVGLCVVGGNPGVGKTSWMVALAALFAKTHDKHVGIFSIEMVLKELAMRFREVMELPKEAEDRIMLCDIPVSPEEAINKAAQIGNLGLICIDFADLMIRGETTESSMSHIYRTLALGAKQLNCPVVLLSQLNRNYTGGIPRPMHLRYTGLAEALAWVVLMLYNPSNDYFAEPESDEDLLPIKDNTGYIICWKIRGGFRNHKDDAPGAIELRFHGDRGWRTDKIGRWHSLRKLE